MPRNVVVLLDNAKGRELIKKACKARKINFEDFTDLVQAEVEQTGKQRKAGLWYSFDDILDRIKDEA